jgi:hypothetical protein
MKALAIVCALAGAALADDDPPDWVFCTKPCTPSPVTNRVLDHDELHAGLVCKHGTELAVDAKQRLVKCTTARTSDLGGLPLTADDYTIFHANGRIYQTTTRAPITRDTPGGLAVGCATGLVVLDVDGNLESCTLARPLAIKPAPRVGGDIGFHRNGTLSGLVLDAPLAVGSIAWPAGTHMMWTPTGVPSGGTLQASFKVGALVLTSEFTLHPGGALHAVQLDEAATVRGREFPMQAKLSLRPDGSLESAEFVSKRGFMIHGEPWTDTTHQTFDAKGNVTSSSVTHFQSNARPPPKR